MSNAFEAFCESFLTAPNLGDYRGVVPKNSETVAPKWQQNHTDMTEFFHNHHVVPDKHPNIGFTAIADETHKHVFLASHAVDLYYRAMETLNRHKDNQKL